MSTVMDVLVTVDFELVELFATSHVGPEYTKLKMRNGETLTIKKPFAEVKKLVLKTGES